MDNKDNLNIGYLYIAASAILFSLAGIFVKLTSWSSITINGGRNLFAFFIMLVYLKTRHHRVVINKAVLIGAACNLLMNLTFIMATKLTTAANAIVLQFTEPVFLILFLAVIWKSKPDRKSVIACILVFVGILCIFFDKLSAQGMAGNILAVVSGILYAFVFLIKKMKNSDFESSILISQITSFFLFAPWIFAETDFKPANFVLVILLGVFQMGAAYVLLAKGLDRVTPMAASLASTIEPVLNPVWVALFYGEGMSLIAIFGAAIVIVTSAVYSVLSQRKVSRKDHTYMEAS